MGVNVFDELNARGMIAQTTNAEKTRELLGGKEPVTFYIGFDPTADSLHVGHFVQLMVMAHMQKAGHRPVALLGGGTGMIGDPTGKSDMRKMMTPETIQYHVDCFKKQMSRFVDFSEGKALMVNNADWLLNLNYIDFLREVGVHFSVNRMLTFGMLQAAPGTGPVLHGIQLYADAELRFLLSEPAIRLYPGARRRRPVEQHLQAVSSSAGARPEKRYTA